MATMPTPVVLDLSHNNAPVDFHDLKAAGVQAVWLKATEGITFADDAFLGLLERVRSVGLRAGAYLFLHDGDAVAQAKFFLQRCKQAGGFLDHAIDFERPLNGPLPTAQGVMSAVNYIVGMTGRHPVIYGSELLPELSQVKASGIGNCPLWIARYSDQAPEAPSPWASWHLWQYSEHGQISGATSDVDLSAWNSNQGDLCDWWDSRAVRGDTLQVAA